MKKQLFALLLICLLLPGLVSAQAESASVYVLADYYPARSTLYAAARLDDDFIDQIDALLELVYDGLQGFGVPPVQVRQMLTLSSEINAGSILDWLGDSAAVGIYDEIAFVRDNGTGPGIPEGMYILLQLDDAAAAVAALDELLPHLEKQIEADHITYTDDFRMKISLTPDMLYILPVEIGVGNVLSMLEVETLAADPRFQQVRTELSQDSYDLFMYINTPAYLDLPNMNVPPDLDLNLGPSGIGLAVVDGHVLLADGVQLPQTPFAYENQPRIDEAFLSRIPASMSGVLQIPNLGNFYTSGINQLDRMNAIGQETVNALDTTDVIQQLPVPSEDVEQALAAVGIDLQADLLDWATGDVAVFGYINSLPIVEAALHSQVGVTGNFEFGLMMDASANPEAAARLVDKLAGLLALAAASSEEVTLSTEQITGTEATVVSLALSIDSPFAPPTCDDTPPPQETIHAEFVLAANDEVLVFATRDTATRILMAESGASIVDTAAFQRAQAYFLPEPTFLSYTNGEGFLTWTIANPITTLALLGPQIGCIFQSIVAELGSSALQTPTPTPTPPPTPPPTPTPDPVLIEQQLAPLRYAIRTIDSTSISSTITEQGVIKLRLTLAYLKE